MRKRITAVNTIIEKSIAAGRSNAETLAAVRRAHPHSKVGLPTVNYFRNQLRKINKAIPTAAQAKSR